MESCHSVSMDICPITMEYKPSVSTPSTGGITLSVPPCHSTVYTTMQQLLNILEQLRLRCNQNCTLELGGDQATVALKTLLRKCESLEENMAVTPRDCGTNCISTTIGPRVEDLELEVKRLQQENHSFQQDRADQSKKISGMEGKLRHYQEKNKKFLELNIDLTGQNRSLKDQIQILSDDNRTAKEQCENCKKKCKQLLDMLNKEKLENSLAQQKVKELLTCKQLCVDLKKQNDSLNQSLREKDRRIELLQHKKKKKRLMRKSEEKSRQVKETFFGYDEDSTSVCSTETSWSSSLSHGTLSDEEVMDELTREEMENNFKHLMKEHLELQRLHNLLQSHSNNQSDPEREAKARNQLENDLFDCHKRIEELQTLLWQQDEELLKCKNHAENLQKESFQYEEVLEKNKKLEVELLEALEIIENLEFKICELEACNANEDVDEAYHTLETIPEEPWEMSEGREATPTPSTGQEATLTQSCYTNSTNDVSGSCFTRGTSPLSHSTAGETNTHSSLREGALTPHSYREGALTPTLSDRSATESPEIMGHRLHEAELTASELQHKISLLQQDNASLREKLMRYQHEIPTLEEKEAQEVLKVKSGEEVITHMNKSYITDNSINEQNSCRNDGNTNEPIEQASYLETLLNCKLVEQRKSTIGNLSKSTVNVKEKSSMAGEVKCTTCEKRKKQQSMTDKKKCHKCCQTRKMKTKNSECQTNKAVAELCPQEHDKMTSPMATDLVGHVTMLQHDVNKLREENINLRSHQQQLSFLPGEHLTSDPYDTVEVKMADLLVACENLQEESFCSESKKKQVEDKMRHLERTVNEMETNEISLREEIEDFRKQETEMKKQYCHAQQKIKELKDLVLDKDFYETGLMEKVQFLEKAEVISSRKIQELEQQKQELEQRLQLKEELEIDGTLVDTLHDRLQEMQSENDELSAKLTEMEENEETLKFNWQRVAENDANRIQTLEEKVKVLETLNRDLKNHLREHQDKSPMPSSAGTSIAAELTESESKVTSDCAPLAENSAKYLKRKIQTLEDELYAMEESKNAAIENLQEKIANLKENEIKLSETIVEMENEERELRSKLSVYEGKRSADSKVEYEKKLQALKSSQHDLLDRLDSLEEHEGNLKFKMQEMEQRYESKLDQYEREIALHQEQEEEMTDRLQELEKHEDELMEKNELLQQEADLLRSKYEESLQEKNRLLAQSEELEMEKFQIREQLETMGKDLSLLKDKNKFLEERYHDVSSHEKHLKDQTKKSEQEVSDVKVKCGTLRKQLSELEEENTTLTERVEEISAELYQIKSQYEQTRIENEDLSERVIELDSSEETCLERIKVLEEKLLSFDVIVQKLEVLQDAECRLMERVTELEEIEFDLKSKLADQTSGTTGHSKKECQLDSELNTSLDLSCSVCNRATDTSDLEDNEGQTCEQTNHGKVTGLFERLQLLEAENAKLTSTDNQVKQLSEKVKLLENSEDRLMERVMELEETEDKLRREMARHKISGHDFSIEADFDAIEAADDSLREKIDLMQEEKDILRQKLKVSEEEVVKLSSEMAALELELAEEKQKCLNYKQSFDVEKEKVEEMEKEMSSSKEKVNTFEASLVDLKRKHDELEKILEEKNSMENRCDKCARYENTIKDYVIRCSKLESDFNKQSNELESSALCLKEEKLRVEELKSSVCEISDLWEREKKKSLQGESEIISLRNQFTGIQTELERKLKEAENGNESYKREAASLSSDVQRLKQENQNLMQEKSHLSSQIDLLSNQIVQRSENMCSAEMKSDVPLAYSSSVHNHSNTDSAYTSQLSSPPVLPEVDDSPVDKTVISPIPNSELTKLQDKCQHLESQIQEKSIRVSDQEEYIHRLEKDLQDLAAIQKMVGEKESKIKAMEFSSSLFSDSIQRALHDVDRYLQREFAEQYSVKETQVKNAPNLTVHSGLDDSQKATLLHLYTCVQCAVERLKHQQNSHSRSHDDNQHQLLEKISNLERSEASLRDQLSEYHSRTKRDSNSSLNKSAMLDNPEDILRQRIGELERLEKHLKQQVLDLEHDRDELHEIARKDKNIIHEQNVRLRELQLSERNLKEQVTQFEVSERGLYNKVESLEDKISTMEDRISELQILEMRLKELVRKYKLDEEVWLSQSQTLETSMSELSVNEAKLRKQMEDVEKERDGLKERTQYLQLRVAELENAETEMLTKLKDQENKEISLNSKLEELQSTGSLSEEKATELHMINFDMSQRLDHALQENAALTHHIADLQNQVYVLDQEMAVLQNSKGKLQQELSSLEKETSSAQSNLKSSQIKEVDLQSKIREVEEGEKILKDKISTLQRNENKLKHRIQELESSGIHMPLDVPETLKEKLPRRLEDCQRRIIVLQNQNEKLKARLEDYVTLSTSKSAVKLPVREYNELQNRVALLDDTALHLNEMEQSSIHLHNVLKQLRAMPEMEGKTSQIEAVERQLEASNKTIQVLKQRMDTLNGYDFSGSLRENGITDHSPVSGHTNGPMAERELKGRGHSSESKLHGHLVQNPHDGHDSILGSNSISKDVRESSLSKTTSDPWASIEEQIQTQNMVSLESMPGDKLEAHWRKVESLANRAAKGKPSQSSSIEWLIPVGKATSLHAVNAAPNTRDEELVLGVTFPSESERNTTQNDTDSSPVMKRRKFRPNENAMQYSQTQGHLDMVPPLLNIQEAIDPELQDQGSEDIIMAENYGANYAMPNKSHVVKGQSSSEPMVSRSEKLQEHLVQIEKLLKAKPDNLSMGLSDDEDTLFAWKKKASEGLRKYENEHKENKFLKEEINKLEKELDDKIRYILVLEKLLEQLHNILQMQGSKSDRELLQLLDAQQRKTNHEIGEVGSQKLELSHDVVALNSELNKKERELVARRNEVDSLTKELRQWQEECRLIEDMRTNALDCLHCLEMEAGAMKEMENSLQSAMEENNKYKLKCTTYENKIKDLEIALCEKEELECQLTSLQNDVKQTLDHKKEITSLEERLTESSSLLDDRSNKVKTLIQEVRDLKAKVVSLEYDNQMLTQRTQEFQNNLEELEEVRNAKENASVEMIPLKAKINRLCQKCREKDDLLKRLGSVLKKMKGIGKPIILLEELKHMEAKMAKEEYMTSGYVVPPGGDMYRSPSVTSVSSQEQSDVEYPINGQSTHPDQFDRHQRPLPSRQLPLIKKSGKISTLRIDKKLLPGHMPKNPHYVAMADYDPSKSSDSKDPSAELQLKKGQDVRIIGPLDNDGFYEAEVSGNVGLVPATCVQALNAKGNNSYKPLSPFQRRERQLHAVPGYVDQTPEKILQSAFQQNSKSLHMLSPKGLYLEDQQSEGFSPRSGHSDEDSRRGVPDAPSNFRITQVADGNTCILTWTPPQMNELALCHGSQVIGYKIYLNGKVHHQVNNPRVDQTVIEGVEFGHQPIRFGIQTLTTAGPVSVVRESVYQPGKMPNLHTSNKSFLASEEFISGERRMFMAIYDYDPQHQSPKEGPNKQLQLPLIAGDVVSIFGDERPDGFCYGELDGKKGLVPSYFIEEIPADHLGSKQELRISSPMKGQKEVLLNR